MDINNSYQSNNNLSARSNMGGSFGYDLKSEKQEIEEITKEVKKELLAKWKNSYANAQVFPAQIAAMHPEVVDFLLSFNLVSVYDNIAKQANLDAKGRNTLPRVVWQIAQAKSWDGLDQVLESQLPLVHSAHVQVANFLQQNILNKIQAISEKPVQRKIIGEEQVQKKEVQLPLSQALSQYPKLGEQNVTVDQIKLKYFPTPVRPSIKNWITDFHDAMGAMKHSPIDRGNFLFHSENGKKLTPIERQKLGAILKSLDEQTLLTIDPVAQVVVFENAETSQNLDRKNTENLVRPSLASLSGNALDSRFHGNDKVQAPIQRVNRPDINLKQEQKQQHIVSHDVFGDLTSVSKPETIQEEQFQKKVEGFFTRPENAEKIQNITDNQQTSNSQQSVSPADRSSVVSHPDVLNENTLNNRTSSDEKTVKAPGGIVKNFFSSVVAPVPTLVETDKQKSEVKNDFFQIPQSKPPIGSEHYNVENMQDLSPSYPVNVAPKPGKALDSLPTGQAGRFLGNDNAGQFSDERVNLNKTSTENTVESSKATQLDNALNSLPTGQAGHFHGNDNAGQSSGQQNRDSMSDEMLFKMLQEKKIEDSGAAQHSDASVDKVSFSSPQKLPAEQKTTQRSDLLGARSQTSTQNIQQQSLQQPVSQVTQAPFPQPRQPQRSPYHIGPSDYSHTENVDTKNEIVPKVIGNTVDLRL